MCLIFVAVNYRVDYPLIILGNRDEFYSRPTRDMHWWPDQSILAGKDLKEGGTWLACSQSGRLATVTNYRDLSNIREDATSRGQIPLDAVRSSEKGADCIETYQSKWAKANGFNLFLHDGKDNFWHSNVNGSYQKLEPGIYGISNALLDTLWPKLEEGKRFFKHWLDSERLERAVAFEIMAERKAYPDNELPDTGVGKEMEKMLSSICIVSEIYGSRSTTLVMKDKVGKFEVHEKNLLNGNIQTFQF